MLAPANKVLGISGVGNQPQLRLSGVSGRALQGSVDTVTAGTTTINDLHWTAQPVSLLMGKLAAQVALTLQGSINARGHVAAGLGGAVSLSDWHTALTLEQLKPLLQLPFLPVEGNAKLRLEQVRLNPQQRPEYARGELLINQLQWTLIRPASELGDFVVRIDTDDNGVIIGTVQDKQAKIGVSGTVSLNPDGSYAADLQLAPRPETPPMIRNTLPTLGRPNPDGSYPVRQQGRIPGW